MITTAEKDNTRYHLSSHTIASGWVPKEREHETYCGEFPPGDVVVEEMRNVNCPACLVRLERLYLGGGMERLYLSDFLWAKERYERRLRDFVKKPFSAPRSGWDDPEPAEEAAEPSSPAEEPACTCPTGWFGLYGDRYRTMLYSGHKVDCPMHKGMRE